MKSIVKLFLEDKLADLTLSESTKKTYSSMCNRLVSMINVSVEELDMSGLSGKEKAKVIVRSKRVWSAYHKKIKELGLSEKNYLNMYSLILSYAQKEHGYLLWSNYRVKEIEKPVVVLKNKEVDRLLSVDKGLYTEFPISYCIACVQLQTTLRIIDVLNLTHDNIKGDAGNYSIETINKKTGKLTSAPVTGVVANCARIIIKNEPRYYDVWVEMKKFLKELGYDHGGSHIFRRSAITYMLSKGVPSEYVRHLSGHSINSKAFARYVNLSNDDVSNTIRKIWT